MGVWGGGGGWGVMGGVWEGAGHIYREGADCANMAFESLSHVFTSPHVFSAPKEAARERRAKASWPQLRLQAKSRRRAASRSDSNIYGWVTGAERPRFTSQLRSWEANRGR
jgi:hypothetical protein